MMQDFRRWFSHSACEHSLFGLCFWMVMVEHALFFFVNVFFVPCIRQFAAERALHFQTTCPDGSQPLIWTQLGT